MARLIGKDLIDTVEDLRNELENLIEINKELDERHKKPSTSSIFSQTKNSNFLNKELVFMMEDLQDKATKSGLSADALIPLTSKKDMQIFNYLKQQQQDTSSDQTTMRSSFYSSTTDDVCLDNNKSEKAVSKLNIKNILELS